MAVAAPRRKKKANPYAMGYRRAMGIPENAAMAGDPVKWVREVLGEFTWSKQQEILESVAVNRYTAVQSCHDIGKSYTGSRAGSHHVDTKPDPFLVTTAPTWAQVNAILWREIRKAHKKAGLDGRINLEAQWFVNHDQLIGFGRKPADYDQSAFQGIHALNVMVIIDEACGVPKTIFDAVDALATNVRARVLAIGNPDDPASHFAEVCKPGSGWNVIKVSAFDTPGYIGEPEYTGTPEMEEHDRLMPDTLLDLLISKEWVEERKKRWGEKSPIYISKVMGEFPEISDKTLLTPKMIRESQERDLREETKFMRRQLGVDVARFGENFTSVYRAQGGRVRKVARMHMADTVDTSEFVRHQLIMHPDEYAYVDVIGVGGGVFDTLVREGRKVREHNSSHRAYDPERFGNRRAEIYWNMREMAENGELDLPPHGEDDDLIAQLGSIQWKIMGGRIYIESKEEMMDRGMPSPDDADACVMALIKGANIKAMDVPDDDKSETAGLMTRAM